MFYPEDEPVSVGLIGQDMVLEPLSTRHVELDYEAVMESKKLLRRWSLSDWPGDDFTIEENANDLIRHENQHFDRDAFTYTVLKPDATECFGCVYINPLSDSTRSALEAVLCPADVPVYPPPRPRSPFDCAQGDMDMAHEDVHHAQSLEHVAVATFWVRQSRLTESLDRVLLEKLIYWFDEEFSFDKVLFSTAEADDRQASLFRQLGLKQFHRSESPDDRGARLFFA